MAADDDIQWDPATFPQNQPLIEELNTLAERAEQAEARRQALLARVSGAVRSAALGVEKLVLDRQGKYAREEDLRGGIVVALRERDELVLTEAKLAVPGWTSNLGGFDFALVDSGAIVLGETKWADGNLYECSGTSSSSRPPRRCCHASTPPSPSMARQSSTGRSQELVLSYSRTVT